MTQSAESSAQLSAWRQQFVLTPFGCKVSVAASQAKQNIQAMRPPRSRQRYYCHKKAVYLTASEYRCLCSLRRHSRMKDLAGVLNLSVRTVEYHLRRVRKKLHCSSKQELLQKYSNSDFIAVDAN